MKLEKYLADYLRTEFERQIHFEGQIQDDIFSPEIIKQGLDAFESTENRKIVIMTINTFNEEFKQQ